MIKNQKEDAVAEILGTVLLLLIVVLVMAVIYFQILSDDGPQPETHVDIVGDIYNDNVTLTHKGGESLDANDKIIITIGGEKEPPNAIWELLDDNNTNGKWDFGEKVLYKLDKSKILENISKYEFIDVTGVDSLSNSIVFQGPVYTKYRSDVGLEVTVSNNTPGMGTEIYINISAWCYGGDIAGAGNVNVNCNIPEELDIINFTSDQGIYDPESDIWNIGNLLVDNSPVNLSIKVKVNAVPYHEPTQLGLIFEGSEYTNSAVSVWQTTYLSGLRYVLVNNIIPHDESVELTVVACGWIPPQAHAEVLLTPTIVNGEKNSSAYFKTIGSGQGLRNEKPPLGVAPISSSFILMADQLYNSANFSFEKRQIIIIITSGNPDCLWNETKLYELSNGSMEDGYGGDYKGNIPQVELDTINAVEYLNTKIEFNIENDELNAITVAKTVDLRDSIFFNENIVMPKPGNIYDKTKKIVNPGWVYEIEPGQKEFQDALVTVMEWLFNSIRIQVNLDSSTTIDPNSNNDISVINIQPSFV